MSGSFLPLVRVIIPTGPFRCCGLSNLAVFAAASILELRVSNVGGSVCSVNTQDGRGGVRGAAERECHRDINSQGGTLPMLLCRARGVFGMRGVVFEQAKLMGHHPMTSKVFHTKSVEQVGMGPTMRPNMGMKSDSDTPFGQHEIQDTQRKLYVL
jgi:hypothetical protein